MSAGELQFQPLHKGMILIFFLLGFVANHPSFHKNIVVASFSPPKCHEKIIVSIEDHRCTSNNYNQFLSYDFNVVDRCEVKTLIPKTAQVTRDEIDRNTIKNKMEDSQSDLNMIDVLLKWNPNGTFPSKSQAKRSLERGKVLLFNDTTTFVDTNDTGDEEKNLDELHMSLRDLQPLIATISSVLKPQTTLVLVEPISSIDRYPITVTRYAFPPIETIGLVPIVYEDNHLAIVNKPENMTTIGSNSGRPNDLQSVLGFLLRPSPLDPAYHPRPVHRLDRRTSGLVLIAKTQSSMRKLSKAFATRTVTKTYSALVFERDSELSARLDEVSKHDTSSSSDTTKWLMVDYPIEKREAVSEVRRVTIPKASPSSYLWKEEKSERDQSMGHDADDSHETFSVVEVRPKTGRNHQIRRHLSYCLGMPIVGDSKYDGGARHLRTNGMYLCCHSLTFSYPNPMASGDDINAPRIHPDAFVKWNHSNSHGNGPCRDCSMNDESQFSISIPLPVKFKRWTNF